MRVVIALVLLLMLLNGCKKPKPVAPEQLQSSSPLGGIPTASDLDGDGLPNRTDPAPLVSKFPLVVFHFPEPKIGIRYNISGAEGATETRSNTDTSTNSSNITKSSKFSNNYEDKYEDQTKASLSLSLGADGGVSFLPSFEVSKTTTSTMTYSKETIFSTDDVQSRILENKRFTEFISQKDVKFDANSGYVRGSVSAWNFSSIPIEVGNIKLAVTYRQGAGREPFINSIPLKTSNLSATLGPIVSTGASVGTDPQAVTLGLAAADLNRASVLKRAVVLSDLPFTDVQDLSSENDVTMEMQDYTLDIDGAQYTRSQYEQARDQAVTSLVTVTVDGPSGTYTRLISPTSLAGIKHTMADVLQLVSGHAPRLLLRGNMTIVAAIDGVQSDLSWTNRGTLIGANPSLGRWVVLTNDGLNKIPLNSSIKSGDTLKVSYIMNRDLQSQVYETGNSSAQLDRSASGLALSAARGVLNLAGIQRDRVCGDVVRVGDVVDLTVRTYISSGATAEFSAVGKYPELGKLLGSRRCSTPVEYLPAPGMASFSRDQLLSEGQVFVSFGEAGPPVSMETLVAQLPASRVAMFSDGTLRLRLAIKRHMISKPTRICFGLPQLVASGPVGRKADLQDCGSESGINRLTCNVGVNKCRAWLDGSPYRATDVVNRISKSEISIDTYLKSAP